MFFLGLRPQKQTVFFLLAIGSFISRRSSFSLLLPFLSRAALITFQPISQSRRAADCSRPDRISFFPVSYRKEMVPPEILPRTEPFKSALWRENMEISHQKGKHLPCGVLHRAI